MALAAVARGTFASTGTQPAVTCSGATAAGSLLVLVVAYDNAGASGADPYVSVSDAKGNTWTPRHTTRRSPGNATNDGTMLRIFTTRQDVAPLALNDGVFMDCSASVRSAVALWEVTAGAGKYADYLATGTGATGASTAPSVTTGSIAVGDMVVGGVADEYGTAQTLSTPDADTTNGTWNTRQYAEVGSTTSGQNVTTQCKVQTTTPSTQAYNLTMATSADWAAGWISVHENAGVDNRNAALGALASGTSMALAGTHAGTHALGALTGSGSLALVGKHGGARAVGSLAGAGTQALVGKAGKAGATGNLATGTATISGGAGRHGGQRALAALTATTSMAATGVAAAAADNRNADLGTIQATASLATPTPGRKAARASAAASPGTSMAATGRGARQGAAGVLAVTATASAGSGRHGAQRAVGTLSGTSTQAEAGRKGATAALAQAAVPGFALAARHAGRGALGTISASPSLVLSATTGQADNRNVALGSLAATTSMSAAGRKGAARVLGVIGAGTAAPAAGLGRKGSRADLTAAYALGLALAGRTQRRGPATMALGAAQAAQGRKAARGAPIQSTVAILAAVGQPGRAGATGDLALAALLVAEGVANKPTLSGTELAGVAQDAYGATSTGTYGVTSTGDGATVGQAEYSTRITEG